jgi:hypothetical protein
MNGSWMGFYTWIEVQFANLHNSHLPYLNSYITYIILFTSLSRFPSCTLATKTKGPMWERSSRPCIPSGSKDHGATLLNSSNDSHTLRFFLLLSTLPPPYLLHFYRAHPPTRVSSTSVHSHGADHCVVGPCMNGHLFTPGLKGPKLFLFFFFFMVLGS